MRLGRCGPCELSVDGGVPLGLGRVPVCKGPRGFASQGPIGQVLYLKKLNSEILERSTDLLAKSRICHTIAHGREIRPSVAPLGMRARRSVRSGGRSEDRAGVLRLKVAVIAAALPLSWSLLA